jgi:hypothetical protein
MSRVDTRATPKKTSRTPIPSTAGRGRAEAGTKSPYRSAAKPSAPATSAPTVRDGKSAHAEQDQDETDHGEQTSHERVPGVVLIDGDAEDHAGGRHGGRERRARMRSSGSPGSDAPSRTRAIGGTVVARRPG